jgi:hypothetical protein
VHAWRSWLHIKRGGARGTDTRWSAGRKQVHGSAHRHQLAGPPLGRQGGSGSTQQLTRCCAVGASATGKQIGSIAHAGWLMIRVRT